MQPVSQSFKAMIQGTRQFIIPQYQRRYSWDKKRWEQLWEDIRALYVPAEDTGLKSNEHFIGAIVSVYEGESESGISRHLIVDGQQRLTTLMILLCALRDRQSSEEGDKTQSEFIGNVNEKGDDYHRVFHTDTDDRQTFARLSLRENQDELRIKPKDNIALAYKFFWEKLAPIEDLERMRRVITAALRLVLIQLEGENPYVIFESLNAKNTPLTQADLIRNYFFMHVSSKEHDRMYLSYWKPMEDELTEKTDRPKPGRAKDYLTECIRHSLMRKGTVVDTREVYVTLKNEVDHVSRMETQLIAALADLYKMSVHYAKLLWPEREPDCEIARRLTRLNILQVTTAYPLLLNLYSAVDDGEISTEQFASILDVLLNFLIRRQVCGVGVQGLNKQLCKLAGEARKSGFDIQFVKEFLTEKKYRYPDDQRFRQALIETSIYKSDKIARIVLMAIEESFEHKEPVDLSLNNIQIEHVLPQTLSEWWENHLGSDFVEIHNDYGDVLGNLTLTGTNQSLGNKPYPEKQKLLADSHFELNKYFQSIPVWNEQTIDQRASILADLCIGTIWPALVSKASIAKPVESRTRGRSPASITILGWRFEVKKWSSLVPTMVDKLLELDPERFNALTERFHRYIRTEKGKWTQAQKLANSNAWIRTNWPADEAIKFCEDVADTFDLSETDWCIEFTEDNQPETVTPVHS